MKKGAGFRSEEAGNPDPLRHRADSFASDKGELTSEITFPRTRYLVGRCAYSRMMSSGADPAKRNPLAGGRSSRFPRPIPEGQQNHEYPYNQASDYCAEKPRKHNATTILPTIPATISPRRVDFDSWSMRSFSGRGIVVDSRDDRRHLLRTQTAEFSLSYTTHIQPRLYTIFSSHICKHS